MTNHPSNWNPERIPTLHELIGADGAVACTLSRDILGAGADEMEATKNARANVWARGEDGLQSLRPFRATKEAVGAVLAGKVEGVTFEPRLDLFACSVEIQAAEARIEAMERKWHSWVQTKKREWEEKKGPFLCRLLEQMAWAFARHTDDGTVTIIDETPRWNSNRASDKERNALVAALAFDSDDDDYVRKYTEEIARIGREVEARWASQAYSVSLSDDLHRAAEEIGFCLGDQTHLEALNPPPRHKLKMVCEAIWGEEWITPLARELGMSVRTAHRYAAGDTHVPDDIFVRLAPRVAKARQELAARIDALSRV